MAATLGNTGSLLRAQGKLADALAHYRQTLDLSNQAGHRSSAALAWQAIGLVLADQGDLSGAQKMFQEALAIQQDLGEKSNYAETLRGLGQATMQQGDLQKARQLLDQALSAQQTLGEMGTAADTRLALAELDCDSGHPDEAEPLARAALQVFQTQKEADGEIFAAALLSRSHLEQGKLEEAAQSLDGALKLEKKGSDITARLSLDLAYANVLAEKKDLDAAERVARKVLAEAPKDLLRVRLEAEVTVARIQARGQNPAEGRRRLQEISRTAREKGFELIALKASNLASR